MDPVVAGAVATVLVSVVSGVVKTVRLWIGREVELARITHEALTERVRCTAPVASLRESRDGHHVQVVAAARHGAERAAAHPDPRIGGGRRGGGRER
ncbi:hypothetical protein [Streptomyces spectabilis]|uniref:Uncharacterized protein n=1 Tax=Streptomyces spectabilis TaxID=68270 RepID=A0A516RJ31_STRST|nr:hypothetical protein [Streptomyces spectabilis]QDQ15659.1 hypothetical protein FH965_38145 [Streptomyces spectabilis]